MNITYYIGPPQVLQFTSWFGTIIAAILSIFGIFIFPFRRLKWKVILKYLAIVIGVGICVLLIFIGVKMAGKSKGNIPEVIVLGMDGLDPKIVEELMAKGELPNFTRLRERGFYSHLGTTNPAQSPVAWSSFISGMNPGGHGVFDFLKRDKKTYLPDLSLSEFNEGFSVKIGSYKIPISKPRVVSSMKARPFWELTSKKGIKTIVLRCPMTFPPDKVHGKMLSGFGVPDLLGTQGTFTYYTDSKWGQSPESVEDMGGRVIELKLNSNTANTFIPGPRNTLSREATETRTPLTLKVDKGNKKVMLCIGAKCTVSSCIELEEGRWSDWVRLEFQLNRFTKVHGICRFYLREIEPNIGLYLSPINFDPERPAYPISYPGSYSKELSKKIGLYHTLGMAEETWGLNEGRLTEEAYLEGCNEILKETEEMLMLELDNFREGLLICVFGTPDRIQHMFWREYENNDLKYKGVIPEHYKRLDEILGKVLNKAGDDAVIIVLSDHGFGSFRKAVHLNRWLAENNFMDVDSTGEFFEGVDWEKTKAYAVGLNSIYINRRGREGKGIVESEDVENIKDGIIKKLESLTDPETGKRVVKKVYKGSEIFHGPYADEAPDLVVGFNTGYRASWQTALGGAPERVIEENKKRWTGDHCFDPSLVPGVLFCNRKMEVENPKIIDMAPTILKLFGIDIPVDLSGHSLTEYPYTKEDEETIKSRLAGLGYVE